MSQILKYFVPKSNNIERASLVCALKLYFKIIHSRMRNKSTNQNNTNSN